MAEENVLDLLVLLAQNIEEDENRNWSPPYHARV
jgi:hypothetical protein